MDQTLQSKGRDRKNVGKQYLFALLPAGGLLYYQAYGLKPEKKNVFKN